MSSQNQHPTGAEVLIPATMVISLSFLAIAVPLYFSREWVELGWIAAASLLWFFSCRIKDTTFTLMSLVFFLLAAGQIIVVDLVPLLKYEPVQLESKSLLLADVEWPGLAFSVILMLCAVATFTYSLGPQASSLHGAGKMPADPDRTVEDRIIFTKLLGGIGLWLFWGILTMELIHYFQCREHVIPEPPGRLIAALALSLFWVIFARLVQSVGLSFDSAMLRRCSVCMFMFVAVKIFAYDIWLKPLQLIAEELSGLTAGVPIPDNIWGKLFGWLPVNLTMPVWNMYAFQLLVVATVMIGAATAAHYAPQLKNHLEKRFSFYLIGLVGLILAWLVFSIECYYYYLLRDTIFPRAAFLAVASLTVLWTVFSLLVFGVGIWKNLMALRFIAQSLLMLTAVKALASDFMLRPESYETPLLNPYGYAVLALILATFFVGFWTNRSGSRRIERKTEERTLATFLGGIGLTILWFFLSQETYLFTHKNAFLFDYDLYGWRPFAYLVKSPEYFEITILSIVWATFGLTLFYIGMKGHSYVLRSCGYVVLFITFFKAFFYDLVARPGMIVEWEYNFSSLPILCVAIALMLTAVYRARADILGPQASSLQRAGKMPADPSEATVATVLGVLGLILLWSLLSVECFTYFHIRPTEYLESEFLARISLTVLWTLLGSVLLILGISEKSIVLKSFGLLGLLLAAGKSLIFDMTRRPEAYLTPFWNPFAVPIFLVVLVLIIAAVWSTRIHPAKSQEERTIMCGFGLFAIAILWMLLSVESSSYFLLREAFREEVRVHFATVSVSLTWLLFAAVLFGIAIYSRSEFLRHTAVFLSGVVVAKVVIGDLFYRPDFFEAYWAEYYVPVFNTYMMPQLFLSAYLMIVGIIGFHRMSSFLFNNPLTKWEKDKYRTERDVYRIFSFCGLAILLVSSSIECFRAFNSDRISENLQAAQMSLSILWSIFGGVLLFIGFRWRSSILRWCSIILLTLTTGKVFCIDLASISEEYRIGAFFSLAVILVLAARAYQRFRPEA